MFTLCDYCKEREAVEVTTDGTRFACWDCYATLCEQDEARAFNVITLTGLGWLVATEGE